METPTENKGSLRIQYVILNAETQPELYIIENPAERTHSEEVERIDYRIALEEIRAKGFKVQQ